jgi:ssDNA-binding Zn-finger/Zn-ribbon topoisomerase 1
MTNEELRRIDISNLRFYARMANEFKWGTDVLHFGVIVSTLDAIADRLGAAVSASPQPRCPECGNTDLRWSNGRTILFCYNGKPYPEHSFDVSTVESFWRFFAPAPAQEPRCEYIFRDIGTGLRCDKKSGHDGDHHATMGNIKKGIHIDDPDPAPAQPVENSSRSQVICNWRQDGNPPFNCKLEANHAGPHSPISSGASTGEPPPKHQHEGFAAHITRLGEGVWDKNCPDCQSALDRAAPSPTPSVSTEPRCPKCDLPMDEKAWSNGDANVVCSNLHIFPVRQTSDFAQFFAAPSVAGTQPTPKIGKWIEFLKKCHERATRQNTTLTFAADVFDGLIKELSGAAQGTPQVEEIAREVAEKLVAMHLIVWQGLGQAMDEYAKETAAILRKHRVGAPAQPGPQEKR